MRFVETTLKGAYVIEPSPIKDERGLFARTFCKNEFSAIGHHKEFVQFNQSLNKQKGTLRGLHFQKAPHAEIKLIRCINGKVFDVMVDLRSGSPTYLKWHGEILTPENMKMLYIPEGFAHGFQTLEDNTELLYHHTEFYMPAFDSGINPFDKTINITWPIETTVISEKDKALLMINSNSNFF